MIIKGFHVILTLLVDSDIVDLDTGDLLRYNWPATRQLT